MAKTKQTNDKSSAKVRRGKLRRADTEDRHRLYEKSVQATDFEYDFIDTNFKRLSGHKARVLREDFCGTAQMCCEWVRHRRDNRAIGVDLDEEVLGWGRDNNVAALTPAQRKRVTLVEDNVMTVQTEPVDIVVAMNFSWQVFETRDLLRAYFEHVRESLADDGVFFLDIFGGYEAQKEMKEKTKHKGFTYIWDQVNYDPITGHMSCNIHFHFDDGSKMKRAFSYEWRLWSLPEVRELLAEAGFGDVTIYWQGEDEEGEPDGIFLPAEKGVADPAWICMISARK